ncbi:DUF1850 domain-containing protein [Faunimonas sp. B44]|uniref:DUF1850 domain-containing protein n=1 Tax=Faunimonas sp. B44 TaxID=3461493 RepID=UPI00404396B0
MTGFCLAGGGAAAKVAALAFSLSWTHTIERTEWSERWEVRPDGLVVVEASVATSGAGMEPPDGARLAGGRYVWQPAVPPLPELVLRRAAEAGDWTLCAAGRCDSLGTWLGTEADPVRIVPAEDGCSPGRT